jgi:hypothetical protein
MSDERLLAARLDDLEKKLGRENEELRAENLALKRQLDANQVRPRITEESAAAEAAKLLRRPTKTGDVWEITLIPEKHQGRHEYKRKLQFVSAESAKVKDADQKESRAKSEYRQCYGTELHKRNSKWELLAESQTVGGESLVASGA